jgi:hypothetical protein
MSSRIVLLLLLCVGFAFWSKGSAEQASCIVSGSIVREAANSAVSLPVANLDAVACFHGPSSPVSAFDSVMFDLDVSTGGNLNSLSVGLMFIFR